MAEITHMNRYEQTFVGGALPLLTIDDPVGVARFLAERDWLENGELVMDIGKAGEGNMNLTLRVQTDRRAVVLKQSRPWVEKYPSIAAPWDRALIEARFNEAVAGAPAVAGLMPALLAFAPEARALLFEHLADASDLTDAYSGTTIRSGEIDALADYLVALHSLAAGSPDPALANDDMRALNHAHIFHLPLTGELGLDLDGFEPGLAAAAAELRSDGAYRARVAALGERYLGAPGKDAVLLHGDFFPGSWLRHPVGLAVIDAEFCFFGDRAFDLGVAVAHLVLARQPTAARRLIDRYTDAVPGVAADRLAGYAGIEVMRRLIGVAQLPLPDGPLQRVGLLRRSRDAVINQTLEPLL